jgi:predicted ATPase
MKITKFSFDNKHSGWQLVETDFHPHLNLLVGASGVGKTKILNALKMVIDTARGVRFSSLFETKWQLNFDLNSVNNCEWSIEFSDKKGDKNGSEMPLIINELLVINNEIIFKRNKNATYFKGKPTLNLNREESLIRVLQDEIPVDTIYNAFVNHSDTLTSVRYSHSDYNQFSEFFTRTLSELASNYTNIEDIRNSNQRVWTKLALLYSVDYQAFSELKNVFINVFPTVEDIKFDSAYDERYTLFFIKEKGVKDWISQDEVSAGMFKTLIELGRVYLSPDNSLIMIDEFENSLGVNCIDAVTESIVNSSSNHQFIITSHHPYIINNIPVKNWKIVSREGGLVRTHAASEFGIGQSRLSAFTELQQLDVFLTGSESIV